MRLGKSSPTPERKNTKARLFQRVFLSSRNRRFPLQLEKDSLRDGRLCALTTQNLTSGLNVISLVSSITHHAVRNVCRARYIFTRGRQSHIRRLLLARVGVSNHADYANRRVPRLVKC